MPHFVELHLANGAGHLGHLQRRGLSPSPLQGGGRRHTKQPRRFLSSFNPHPSRKTGAASSLRGDWAKIQRFNPHPSRKTGAACKSRSTSWPHGVSILTRLERRVLPALAWRKTRRQKFQSSPVSKDGCCSVFVEPIPIPQGFNPHPSRKTGAARSGCPERRAYSVSILTRLERRVLPLVVLLSAACKRFQSSPVSKDGCCPDSVGALTTRSRFQSSPVSKDGCCIRSRS